MPYLRTLPLLLVVWWRIHLTSQHTTHLTTRLTTRLTSGHAGQHVARRGTGRRDEGGFTAVEWLLIALGVITIAGIAVAAVQTYVTGHTNKLGSP